RPRFDPGRWPQAVPQRHGRQRTTRRTLIGGSVMRTHFAIAAAAMLVLVSSAPFSAQSFKTAWGDPDLQGTWTNQTLTPLERPAEFANKPVLSEQEAAEYEKKLGRGAG